MLSIKKEDFDKFVWCLKKGECIARVKSRGREMSPPKYEFVSNDDITLILNLDEITLNYFILGYRKLEIRYKVYKNQGKTCEIFRYNLV